MVSAVTLQLFSLRRYSSSLRLTVRAACSPIKKDLNIIELTFLKKVANIVRVNMKPCRYVLSVYSPDHF